MSPKHSVKSLIEIVLIIYCSPTTYKCMTTTAGPARHNIGINYLHELKHFDNIEIEII